MSPEAEKVSVLQTPYGFSHTTFNVQLGAEPGFEAVSPEAEKVVVLDPGRDQTLSNAADAFPNPYRTAFYAQTGRSYD